MSKKYVIVITLLVIFTFNFNSYIMADEVESISEEVNVEEKNTDTENKEKVLETIKACKEELKQELDKIDEKIDSIKQKQEYINYPAIRLNVDTPVFGLTSVCNYKLRITSEVSTADVARGYSIKDIIRNNSLKVPSFSVSSIVVITRDIKFDESITLVDANTSILKLMQYIEQVQSVNEFLDKQIIKIYSEYIPKEKSEKINNLKSRISNIESGLNEVDEKLTRIYISNINNEKYTEYSKEYLQINSNVYNYTKVLENVLIGDETLLEYERKVVELESIYLKLKQDVIKSDEEILEKLEFEKVFEDIRNELITRKENVQKYIEASSIKQDILKENESLEENQENKENPQNNSEKIEEEIIAEEEIKVYDITSVKIVEDLNKIVDELDKKIIDIVGQTVLNRIKNAESVETVKISEEIANKEEVTNVVTKELTVDEKNKLLNDVLKLYNEFLVNENKFYLDNINLLLKDTTTKISTLSKYTDYSTISDIRYIYMELPKLLENDTNIYSMKLNIEIKNLINNIKEKLQKLVTININITKVYNEKISEEMKNTSIENN